MLRNAADSQADSERFIKRVAASELVWYLANEDGSASAESNEFATEEDEPVTVLLFFSDEAYARRCQSAHFDDHEIRSIPLFDFLFRWLPGMSGDGVLAGTNWSHDLVGLELDPFDLREQVEAALSPAQSEEHARLYHQLTQGA